MASSPSRCSSTSTSPPLAITPFEWLTSPASVHPHVLSALQCCSTSMNGRDDYRVLHVGCGSSLLGESLVANPSIFHVRQVVNVDNDAPTLQRMKERWLCQHQHQQHLDNDSTTMDHKQERMLFEKYDFSQREVPLGWDDATFDLVIDKSTLDCLLCTDTATAGLLTEVYRVMKQGAVYLLFSFYPIDFLEPLLTNLPGADWDVSSCIMNRQVEDLIKGIQTTKACSPMRLSSHPQVGAIHSRNTLNVVQCRKRTYAHNEGICHKLDWDLVYLHVHNTNDQWFRHQNPLLSDQRKRKIRTEFGDRWIDLDLAYHILFTEVEREQLDFKDFLDDWRAFREMHREIQTDTISAQIALTFMDEMQ